MWVAQVMKHAMKSATTWKICGSSLKRAARPPTKEILSATLASQRDDLCQTSTLLACSLVCRALLTALTPLTSIVGRAKLTKAAIRLRGQVESEITS